MRKKQLEKLLEKLDDAFDFLGWKYNISGMTKEDIKQELKLMVIEVVRKEKTEDKGLGWWFNRAQWYLLNKVKRSARKPLDNSISLEGLFTDENN